MVPDVLGPALLFPTHANDIRGRIPYLSQCHAQSDLKLAVGAGEWISKLNWRLGLDVADVACTEFVDRKFCARMNRHGRHRCHRITPCILLRLRR